MTILAGALLAVTCEAASPPFAGATYGTGAPIGFLDRKQVEEVLDKTRGSGYVVAPLQIGPQLIGGLSGNSNHGH